MDIKTFTPTSTIVAKFSTAAKKIKENRTDNLIKNRLQIEIYKKGKNNLKNIAIGKK